MVTLSELNRAINNKIKSAISETEFKNVEIVAKDLEEPIIRPSFKVDFDGIKSGKLNSNCKERDITVRIYYFASSMKKYRIENFKMQDILENAFLDDLQITEEFFIPILDVESDISDSVLICSFDLYSVELLIDNDSSELMEELNMNM